MKRPCAKCFVLAAALAASQAAPIWALPTSSIDVTPPQIPSLPSSSIRRPDMPLEFFNFLKDCFQVNVADGQQQYAAWLPLQAFVRMYATAGGDITALEPKVNDLKPYLMFIVENRATDQYKNSMSESAESLRARTVLRFPDGTEVKPLDKTPEGMPAAPPSFGNLAGRHGQLLIFPSADHTDLDTEHARKGKIQLVLNGNDSYRASSFTWHLPLELAGSSHQCSRCHNDLSAKWSFCPWCGLKQKQ